MTNAMEKYKVGDKVVITSHTWEGKTVPSPEATIIDVDEEERYIVDVPGYNFHRCREKDLKKVEKQEVTVHNWGHANPEDIEALGFKRPDPKENALSHGVYEVTDQEKYLMMKKLFDGGFNVMLLHANEHRKVEVIMVNTGKFGQR